MAEKLQAANNRIRALEEVERNTSLPGKNEKIKVGVDLGTAYIVLVALGEKNRPLAVEMQYAQVVRDGLVVDFVGARQIVARLKDKLEERLGRELLHAAIAVPPGTQEADCKSHKYVVEGAGFDVTEILDEPTAANGVLGIRSGAIVDIGGGTTGISVLQEGKVVYVADEATGGVHLSLVLAGHYKIPYEEAESLKKDNDRHQEILPVVRPVLEKMASIVKRHISGYAIENIYLVGGTCCLTGMEKIFQDYLCVPVHKPQNPFLVTPLGIALGSGEG
ncbi:ethanolamine utilization protein EutJ [Proteiniclasticum ruminis]|uniref:Ethanolamine utilization protein EutJ n=1 Tax=Proteiniclasticum ruminis TaxID=398199 RepID=A0A1G8KGU5_9CLOT|nr:ethanolamine utilization protein EutJ [Proteiniclasticum ruminis]SDI42639.1 ethanolamine utilization protein EutJ [Proteiniclasticum ruminis]